MEKKDRYCIYFNNGHYKSDNLPPKSEKCYIHDHLKDCMFVNGDNEMFTGFYMNRDVNARFRTLENEEWARNEKEIKQEKTQFNA